MPLKTSRDENPTLNLTPMIDVVFLLIIFFMVSTTFLNLEKEMDLNLPEAESGRTEEMEQDEIIINVLADRALLLGYAEGQPRISASIVRRAAREVPDAGRRRPGWLRPALWAAAGSAVVAVAVLLGWAEPAADGQRLAAWRWAWLGVWLALFAAFAVLEMWAFSQTAGTAPPGRKTSAQPDTSASSPCLARVLATWLSVAGKPSRA